MSEQEFKTILETIFKKLEKLDSLPCAVHEERFKVYDDHIREFPLRQRAIYTSIIGLIVTIVVSLVTFSYKWGVLNGKVDYHFERNNDRQDKQDVAIQQRS